MDTQKTLRFVGDVWDHSILPALTEYIRIPNKSPLFDPAWEEHGHMAAAVRLVEGWCREQPIAGLTVEVIKLPGRTPLIYMEVPGDSDDCVLLYGHLDKQPEMVGWSAGLGPWTPVVRGDRLYGRGAADDGYAAFASLTAIRATKELGGRHARCVVLIEACEESGSIDLPAYIEELAPRIGTPSLVVCLDSGCGNYDQLWCTTSLRGLIVGNLDVQVLTEGVHSGDASGIVPSSLRILRSLLSRLEDEASGAIRPAAFHVEIPSQRVEQARVVAGVLRELIHSQFPFPAGMRPVAADLTQLVLNRSWRPALEITGAAGLPALQDAGNVLRPNTTVKISLRVPPTLDAAAASEALRELLEKDPPYGSKVGFDGEKAGAGWDSPPLSPWLSESADRASRSWFGKEPVYMGEGGSIPFMGMLGKRFPDAQFLITGVLGPGSNAHGPNEFLHVPTGKRLTCCVAQVLVDHFASGKRAR